ncbi:MAG: hypothetical protein AAF926_04985, partial [Pseudomonadota bacterium]
MYNFTIEEAQRWHDWAFLPLGMGESFSNALTTNRTDLENYELTHSQANSTIDWKAFQPIMLRTENPDVPGDTSSTTQLVSGSAPIEGSVSETDQDWYRFTLDESEALILSLQDTLGTADAGLTLQIFDESGNLVISASPIDQDGQISLTLIASSGEGPSLLANGVYFAAVSSNTASDYILSSAVPDDDFTADPTTTAWINTDGTFTIASYDFENDVDWLAFDAIAGETIQFTYRGLPFSQAIRDGLNFIADSSIAGASISVSGDSFRYNNFTTDTTGRYYIQIAPSFGTDEYYISANIIDDDYSSNGPGAGTLLIDGTPTHAAFESLADADSFIFEITEETTL